MFTYFSKRTMHTVSQNLQVHVTVKVKVLSLSTKHVIKFCLKFYEFIWSHEAELRVNFI